MGFNYTRDEVMQMSMNHSKRKLDEIERRLTAVEKKLASDVRENVRGDRTKGKCIWCDSPFRIEYYWIDREGRTASFQDEERHLVATGIANFCPNCGADMRKGEEK